MEQIGIFIGILVAIATEPLFHKNYLRLLQTHEMNSGNHGDGEPEVGISEHRSHGWASDGVVCRWNVRHARPWDTCIAMSSVSSSDGGIF